MNKSTNVGLQLMLLQLREPLKIFVQFRFLSLCICFSDSSYGHCSSLCFDFLQNGAPSSLMPGSNKPLRGEKNTLWEGGVRGAAFIWGSMLEKKEYTNTEYDIFIYLSI